MKEKLKVRAVGSDKWIEQEIQLPVSLRYPNLVRRLRLSLLAIILIVATWSLIYFTRTPKHSKIELTAVAIENWDSAPGISGASASYSFDGKSIAYAFRKDNVRDIWVRNSTGEKRQLTNGCRCRDPIWSPDGSRIAYIAVDNGRPNLYSVYISGGAPTHIKTFDGSSVWPRAWRVDSIVFEQGGNLRALNLATMQDNQITSLDPHEHYHPIIPSLVGDRIAFMQSQSNDSAVFTCRADGTDRRVLPTRSGIKNSIAWLPHDKGIVYTVSAGTGVAIYSNVAGDEEQLGIYDADAELLGVAPEGNALLVKTSPTALDVWRVDNEGKEKLISRSSFWPSIDQSGAVFYHTAKSPGELTRASIKAENGATEILREAHLPRWSPDGNHIAYLKQQSQSLYLRAASADGSNEITISSLPLSFGGIWNHPFASMIPREFEWSPDSRSIAYVASVAGIDNIFINSSGGDAEKQITSITGKATKLYSPLWWNDGSRISFVAKDDDAWKLCAVAVDQRESFCALESRDAFRLIGWSADSAAILAIDDNPVLHSEASNIRIVTVARHGRETEIKKLEDCYLSSLALSNNGQDIGAVCHHDGVDNIYAVSVNGTIRKVTNNQDVQITFASLAWDKQAKIYFTKERSWNTLSEILIRKGS